MKAKPKAGGESQVDCAKPDEPTFRYSLELVATIAVHFVDGNTNETAACERAIKLLDAASETIRRKTIILRARHEAERLSIETPKYLPFAKGIMRITATRTEGNAIKPFRDYLRLNLRLSDLGRPSQLTDEQVKALLKHLADGKEKQAEDSRIEEIMSRYRGKGFSQVDLVTIKQDRDFLQAGLVRPFQNSEKGKKGGRPPSRKENRKKS